MRRCINTCKIRKGGGDRKMNENKFREHRYFRTVKVIIADYWIIPDSHIDVLRKEFAKSVENFSLEVIQVEWSN